MKVKSIKKVFASMIQTFENINVFFISSYK